MQLFPAIDLAHGHCVRLYQGDFAQETRYGDDPVAQARQFAGAGAEWIHVVDLDAARTGSAHNLEHIAAIASAHTLPMRARSSAEMIGDGASSSTFWWRRWSEQSRSPRWMALPLPSPNT